MRRRRAQSRRRPNSRRHGLCFGSSHPAGINAAFADASVRAIQWGIDQAIFNALAHRSDGQVLSGDAP